MGATFDAAEVAQPILDALGRRSSVFPGFLAKLLTDSLVPLPRWARVRVMSRVMYGIKRHRLGATDSPMPVERAGSRENGAVERASAP